MPDVHLRNVDLNLLHALHALLEERHVTRAAKRSFLSQPAMSRALDRLRETFGDPLLVRTGRVYERTVRGESVVAGTGIDHGTARSHGARRGIFARANSGTFSRGHDGQRRRHSIAEAN
jgi:hypothetical protein